MPTRVKLADVVEAINILQRRWQAFLNRETGEIVTVTADGSILAEDEEFDEQLLDAEPFVVLPDSVQVDEWSMMERFALERSDRERDELLEAIRGRGAFRMFRMVVRRLGVEEEWIRYHDSALQAIAKEWLDEHRIPYEEDATRTPRVDAKGGTAAD